MKTSHLKRKFFCFVLTLFLPFQGPHATTASALGRDSILADLYGSLGSIVGVESKIAVIDKNPDVTIKNPKTGRIYVKKSAKAAMYKRTGAGVIISSSGLIITNAHIVKKAGQIKVTLYDKSVHKAELIWTSSVNDLAFIGITPPHPLKANTFLDSNSVWLDSTVYTVGSSQFLDGTIAQGKITSIGKRAKGPNQDNIALIETNLILYKGDSGGPLLGEGGRLLGLLFASKTSDPKRTFAIPSNEIRLQYQKMLENIKED